MSISPAKKELMNNIPTLIEKEEIPNLTFCSPCTQSLNSEELKAVKAKLKSSQILGNIHHSKVKIVFEDTEGLKEVRTTIWSTDDDFIVLKKGVFIPLNRVVSIAF